MHTHLEQVSNQTSENREGKGQGVNRALELLHNIILDSSNIELSHLYFCAVHFNTTDRLLIGQHLTIIAVVACCFDNLHLFI